MSGVQSRLNSLQQRERDAVNASTEKDFQISKLKAELRAAQDKVPEAAREVNIIFINCHCMWQYYISLLH